MSVEPPVSLDLDPTAMGPVTDLYQLTMMAGYAGAGMSDVPAVFELFVRKLPPRRSFLIFAGLEQAITALLNLRFNCDQVAEIRTWSVFASTPATWFDQLLDFRFEGDIWAIPEGTVVFPGEPLLRVEAKLPQAQLVETLLLGSLGYPTLVASKAARIVRAARGRGVVDFGARRGHGLQASFASARSAYIAGFSGTSQVEAARRLGIPAFGTMAHSWVQAFDTEALAFETFARQFPRSTLLVDTYDIVEGVRQAAQIEPAVQAIRIDSGDLLVESRRARTILDTHDRRGVKILASGDLDEDSIDTLVRGDAPIDQFGVGTELVTSGGAPAISMVYKLVESAGMGRIKKSAGKRTYPRAKQVIRQLDPAGRFESDLVIQVGEQDHREALLQPVVRAGILAQPWPRLESIRDHCRDQLANLPADLQELDAARVYPIQYSDRLQSEATRLGLEHSSGDPGVTLDSGDFGSPLLRLGYFPDPR